MKQKPSLAHHISSERGIYSVYSPAGGCGKTTFALAYAQELVRRNPEKRVLYWSLQGAEDWPLYFQSSSRYNLSDLLYSLLSDEPIQTDEILQDTVQRQENGVYLIRPCNQARDLCNLAESELERLLSLLSSVFDVILCDLHSSFDELNERIILRSTRRFYLVNDLSTVRYKWNDFMEQLARSPIRENCLDQAVLVCICEKKNEGKSLTRGFPGEVYFFPWSNRLWKEQNGVLKIRQDSSYYECIRKMA